ncbi:glycosyltransferase family 4 protein [Oceanobacillus chungangensis]|uniref:Glycosyl transferase family 1 domain-containing protein n=1 Tax=Oceanobacillus chungangensis TaxID=1229152 RepID=A0A3D8PWV9_9BACI|nr:glycosyltransferase family 4 protein [Oceanobacillus chungangensis]RDW20583.1 hypothetical protein CWR45_04930 [Oceanobacillus chungangensis]
MKRLKILLYVERLSEVTPRSIVRLSSLIKVLMSDEKIELSILTKAALPEETKSVLSMDPKIQWLNSDNATSAGNKDDEYSPPDMSDIIEQLDNEEQYHIIVLHGREIMPAMVHKEYCQKAVPYVTDLVQISNNMIRKSPAVFVETAELKYEVSKKTQLSEDEIILLPPVVNDTSLKGRTQHRRFSMLYRGQITDEIINLFQAVKKKNQNFSMTILSDNLDVEQKELNLLNRYRKLEGLEANKLGMEKEIGQYIDESEFGYLYYPSTHCDSEDILEQFLEYAIQGKPVIINRTVQWQKILGGKYPLFVDDLQEAKEKVILALSDQGTYKLAAEQCFTASLAFQFPVASKMILNKLWKFNQEKQTILFAGHDFKFLKEYIDFCKTNHLHVLIDEWGSHNVHDIERSRQLMQEADIIFCEWGLGNTVFYSNHKLPGQRLYIRVHRQELETNYLHDVNFENVTNVIAISPYIFEEFNRLKKIPRDKLILIQNMVDVEKYQQPKKENIKYNIGIMGILPKLKRFDRAVRIFEKLWEKDKRYKLFIKGKLPEDLPWLKNRKAEMNYFTKVFDKINDAPWKDNLIFDGHGDNVAEWLTHVNFMLSTSEIESFHLAPMEGMASGATPIVFNWPGSDTIYPKEFIVNEIDEAVELILKLTDEDDTEKCKNFLPIVEKYDKSNIIERLNELILK